jgi:hypothetical protein
MAERRLSDARVMQLRDDYRAEAESDHRLSVRNPNMPQFRHSAKIHTDIADMADDLLDLRAEYIALRERLIDECEWHVCACGAFLHEDDDGVGCVMDLHDPDGGHEYACPQCYDDAQRERTPSMKERADSLGWEDVPKDEQELNLARALNEARRKDGE